MAIAGVLVDGPGRNSFDEETYAGYCEGGYGRRLLSVRRMEMESMSIDFMLVSSNW